MAFQRRFNGGLTVFAGVVRFAHMHGPVFTALLLVFSLSDADNRPQLEPESRLPEHRRSDTSFRKREVGGSSPSTGTTKAI